MLDETDHRQLWIPPGLAHGFLVMSEVADLFYKTTDYYAPQHERGIAWDDPQINVQWPLAGKPVLSAKDQAASPFAKAELP
jgi:dTDP-4-dehydrorhamnose 3,5-epimerase